MAPSSIDFGSVPTGSTLTRNFTASNSGASPLTLTRSKPPVAGVGFCATTSLAEATTVAVGATVTETVQYTTTGLGAVADSWQVAGDDGSATHTILFTATGIAGGSVPGPAVGG